MCQYSSYRAHSGGNKEAGNLHSSNLEISNVTYPIECAVVLFTAVQMHKSIRRPCYPMLLARETSYRTIILVLAWDFCLGIILLQALESECVLVPLLSFLISLT